MFPIDREYEDALSKIIRKSLEDFHSEFYIAPRQHHEDHCFTRTLRESLTDIWKTTKRVTTTVIVTSVLSALGFGIVYLVQR